MEELTEEQIKEVVDWLNTWDEIKNTVIPMRFKESFRKQLMLGGVSCQREQLMAMLEERISKIQSEPDGIVRETMIDNLLIGINCY